MQNFASSSFKTTSKASPSNMAVSMKDVDSAFQGAGQKAYPCHMTSLYHFRFLVSIFKAIEFLLFTNANSKRIYTLI